MADALHFGLLGPLEAAANGVLLPLGGPRQRALLALLLVEAGRVVAVERLVEALWEGEGPPATARHALSVYASALRKETGLSLRARAGGYVLEADPEAIDARRFERLVEEGRRSLDAGDDERAAATLREALALWRGPALAEFAYADWAQPEIARLEELRLTALEARLDADLRLGRAAELVPELEGLVREEPLRERPRAQLMLALYRSGRQADALAAYRDARRALLDGLGVEPGEELRRLEQAILRQDAELAVEPAELRARRRLPAPATPLVGRRAEVDELSALVRGGARLVTLTGPGGTGKTRLALRAAHELAASFADGVVFVGLAPLRDPELVPAAVARALELDDTGGLGERLRDRELLLLVDNFEHVDAAAPRLAELLAAAPGLRLLVTSRQSLRLYGEHEYPVQPLPDDDAAALFVARGRATGRPLDDSPAVRELCDRLDRLPLAIELVAARLRELGLERMLDGLRRLDLAADGPRDVPERQRTLRATIGWSVALLDEAERLAFARLGVFAGAFEPDAAEAVCEAPQPLLESLARKSLLAPRAGRCAMLETIREHALELLADEDEAATRRRHAAWFAALAEHADEELALARGQAEWLARLDAAHDDLRAAVEWSAREDRELELRLVVALGRFWEWRGHVREGARRLESALEGRVGGGVLLGRAFLRASVLTNIYGDLARSARLAEQAAAAAREAGDPQLTANALRRLGTLAKDEGRVAEARKLHEEALRLSRETGDERGISSSLMNLADIALLDGRDGDARLLAEQSVELARALGDGMREVVALLNVALASLREGAPEAAAATFAEAASLALGLGYRDGVAFSLDGAGGALVEREPAAAARLLGAAEALLEETGMVLEPVERALHERTVARLRELLEPAALAEEWERGRSLDAEAAASLASSASAAARL